MEKKQTAVEFYRTEFGALVSMKESKFQNENEIFDQAKQMEKEQMKEAALDNVTTNEKLRKIFEIQFEDFYNETYGGTK
jgi:hypothetical protein